jgi:hypothetical protein
MEYIFQEKELRIRTFIREILSKFSLIINKYTTTNDSSNKSHILLRTERQTFRFLPSSSSVAFLVRTLVTPLEEFCEQEKDAIALINALKHDVSLNDNSSKGEYRHELISLLNKKFNL